MYTGKYQYDNAHMAAPHVRMHSNITNVHTIYTGNAVYMAHTYLIHIPLS